MTAQPKSVQPTQIMLDGSKQRRPRCIRCNYALEQQHVRFFCHFTAESVGAGPELLSRGSSSTGSRIPSGGPGILPPGTGPPAKGCAWLPEPAQSTAKDSSSADTGIYVQGKHSVVVSNLNRVLSTAA
eukprot:1159867-Pelagomonas_calceolata.AAC.14